MTSCPKGYTCPENVDPEQCKWYKNNICYKPKMHPLIGQIEYNYPSSNAPTDINPKINADHEGISKSNS